MGSDWLKPEALHSEWHSYYPLETAGNVRGCLEAGVLLVCISLGWVMLNTCNAQALLLQKLTYWKCPLPDTGLCCGHQLNVIVFWREIWTVTNKILLNIYTGASQIMPCNFSLRFALGNSQFGIAPTFLLPCFCKNKPYTWRETIELNLEGKHNWTRLTSPERHCGAQAGPVPWANTFSFAQASGKAVFNGKKKSNWKRAMNKESWGI